MTGGSRRRSRGPLVVAVSVAMVGLATVLAWSVLSATLPSTRDAQRVLTVPGHHEQYSTCTARTSAGEVIVEAGAVLPKRGVDVTDVLLVEPVNVTVIDAVLVPRLEEPEPPVIAAPPTPWRIHGLAPGAWDWSGAVDSHGGFLDPFGQREVLLHLKIGDPARRAAFSDVEVRFRDAGEGRAERLGGAWATIAEDEPCASPSPALWDGR